MWLQDFITGTKWFFRGVKRGDWLWLMLAVMIASSSITVVELLAKTVKTSMMAQATNSLGADFIITSSRPIEQKWLEKAKNLNLEVAHSESLITMALSGDDFQLVQLTAISENFPLRGEKILLDKNKQQILVEPALITLMSLTENSKVLLGSLNFNVAGEYNPQNLSISSVFAHKILMPLANLDETGLKGAGSRVNYQFLVAGSEKSVESFSNLVQKENSPHLQVISAKSPTEDIAKSLDTAWLFLELSALSAILVAGLSILIASRFYLQRWQGSIALMRSFGADRNQIFRLFAWQLSWLSVVSSLVGVILGSWLFQLITPLLAEYFTPLITPNVGWVHLHGFLMGVLVLWGFAWQSFNQAVQTSPLQLLNSTTSSSQISSWLISLALITLLVVSVTGYVFWVLLGLLVVSASLYLSAIALLTLIGYWQKRSKGWLKISLSALTREPALVKMQLISVGLVLFVLMLMTFVRQDLMQNWQMSLPKNTPDTFVMNIQPDQKKSVLEVFSQHKMEVELISMARGRLVAVNDQKLDPAKQESMRAQRLLKREANVGIMPFPVSYNKIIARQDKTDNSLPSVSVEQDIATLFNLALNDTVTFNFSGQNITYQITSIRKVEWQSFRINFFFIVESSEQTLPISYLGNFRLIDSKLSSDKLTKELATKAPGVLLIDAKKILKQLQTIMEQASWSVSSLYLFTLLASLIVLFSATLSSQQSRIQSWLLLRTMGATHKKVLKIGLMEFALLGVFAGLLAASFAQLVSMLVSYFALKMTPQFSLELWFISLVSGVAILLIVGLLTQKKYLRLSPYEMSKKW